MAFVRLYVNAGSALEQAGPDFGNVVAFQSLSKRSNLPGMRVGFAAGDRKFLAAFHELRNVAAPQVPVPLHAVDNPASIGYILADCQASLLLVDDLAQWQRIAALGTALPELRTVIVTAPDAASDPSAAVPVLALAESAGLYDLLTRLSVPSPNAGAKSVAVIGGMLAGAD